MSLPPAIAVVGPSGVGKDTVMGALVAGDPRLALVRRVVTRPEDAGGERITGVSAAEFARRLAAGDFVLHWEAHGLRYGIPADAAAGKVPVMNLSRQVLKAAEALYPGLAVISLTADPVVLAQRLAARGREAGAEIDARLARAGLLLPEGLRRVHVIDNSGLLAATLAAIRAALQPERV